MKKYIAIAGIVTLVVANSMVPAWGADTLSDAALVKLQTASIQALHQSAASDAGYDLKSIEMKHSAHQLTATIVNSAKNSAAAADREKEAMGMASAIERVMTGKPEYQGVAAIHIDYVSRVAKKAKTIQIFDFFRSPANVFVLHKT